MKSKLVIAAVIIMLLAFGLVLFKANKQKNTYPNTPPVTSGDNSDAALDKDLQTVENNLSNLNGQSDSVDQGLNQQPVDPTQ